MITTAPHLQLLRPRTGRVGRRVKKTTKKKPGRKLISKILCIEYVILFIRPSLATTTTAAVPNVTVEYVKRTPVPVIVMGSRARTWYPSAAGPDRDMPSTQTAHVTLAETQAEPDDSSCWSDQAAAAVARSSQSEE